MSGQSGPTTPRAAPSFRRQHIIAGYVVDPGRFKGDDIAERLLDPAAGVVRVLPSLSEQAGAASLFKPPVETDGYHGALATNFKPAFAGYRRDTHRTAVASPKGFARRRTALR